MRWHSIPTCLDRHVSVPYLGFLYCRSQAFLPGELLFAETVFPRSAYSNIPIWTCSGATGIPWMSVAILLSTLSASRCDTGVDLCRSCRVVCAANKNVHLESIVLLVMLSVIVSFSDVPNWPLSVVWVFLRSKLAVSRVPCHPWTLFGCTPCTSVFVHSCPANEHHYDVISSQSQQLFQRILQLVFVGVCSLFIHKCCCLFRSWW